jgi:hypothetical protein
MKRKRTLSGIRAVLDYKNLNVFGDIVGNFEGRNIPSVEDFNTYLQSYDPCDNLKLLSTQNQSKRIVENLPPNKETVVINKRGRKPKKRSVEDVDENIVEDVSVEMAVSGDRQLRVPSAVIGTIGQFFQRFCEKYPSQTPEYKRFLLLVRVSE